MRIIFVILLSLILGKSSKGFVVQTESDQSCHESHQMQEQCGVYAHRIIKPMMAYFDQVNRIIEQNNKEINEKTDKIKTLEEEANQFRVDIAFCTSKDEIIQLLKKKDQSNEELIKSLKQQFNLTNSVDKQLIDLKELQAEANRNAKKMIENELESKKQKIRQLEERVMQLEGQNTKSIEDSICEKQNNQINELNVNASKDAEKVARYEMEIKSQQDQITGLNAKVNSETQEVTILKEQLQNQINITVAKDQEILQLKTEVSETVDKFKERQQQCRNRIGTNSGLHSVTLSNNYTFDIVVLDNSDIECRGWTIIQQRIHGGVNFNRSWEEYKNGFGDFWDGDFFLGLEKIHRLTTEQPHELYIQMQKFDGTTFFARFEAFAISGEKDEFRLSTLGAFSGNITDKFSYNRDMKFSTYDRDNDQDINRKHHCTQKHHGGWWYNNCAYINLNGKYFETEVSETAESIYWWTWVSLKQVKMMIRPKSN